MATPPRTDGDSSLRANLRRAQALLKEAGWEVRDGKLRNARGEAFVVEYLDSNEGGARVISPWARNLEKIGVALNFRPVDFALYQQRRSAMAPAWPRERWSPPMSRPERASRATPRGGSAPLHQCQTRCRTRRRQLFLNLEPQ